MLNWLSRFGAKPADAFVGIISRESRQIHARDGAQQPCGLPFFFYGPARDMGLRATLDCAGVDANLLYPIQIKRNAPVRKKRTVPMVAKGVCGDVLGNQACWWLPRRAPCFLSPTFR